MKKYNALCQWRPLVPRWGMATTLFDRCTAFEMSNVWHLALCPDVPVRIPSSFCSVLSAVTSCVDDLAATSCVMKLPTSHTKEPSLLTLLRDMYLVLLL